MNFFCAKWNFLRERAATDAPRAASVLVCFVHRRVRLIHEEETTA